MRDDVGDAVRRAAQGRAEDLLQSLVADAVEDAEEADAKTVFSDLMGENVEPRKNFIQDNALSVANLDI